MIRQILIALSLSLFPNFALAAEIDVAAVNAAGFAEPEGEEISPALLRAQVILDRRGFSPGVIDGRAGDSTAIALSAFQEAAGLPVTGALDQASFERLVAEDGAEVLVSHTLTKEDLAGPFVGKLPKDLTALSKVKHLGYRNANEALAERFHMHEDLLRTLNPEEPAVGREIVVAAVDAPGPVKEAVDRLVVDKGARTLRVLDAQGTALATYPASIGSEENPAPSGELEILGVAKKPKWNYDPKLSLEGQKDRPKRKLTIADGPNNPVGVVWIDLSKDHFGIHGSPEPHLIGKTQSSGCIRLTNWDASELQGLVRNGMKVSFED